MKNLFLAAEESKTINIEGFRFKFVISKNGYAFYTISKGMKDVTTCSISINVSEPKAYFANAFIPGSYSKNNIQDAFSLLKKIS